MKRKGILNPYLLQEIARVGHTEYFVIADAGLPLPSGVPVIDLSLVRGVPGFVQTLGAVCEELVVQRCIVAEEICDKNPQAHAAVCAEMARVSSNAPICIEAMPHEKFKALLPRAKAVVRTGETTPYANCILVGGVNF